MSPNSLKVIKIILGVVAGFFTFLTAFFGFWEVLQDDDHGKIREWFRRKWMAINNSRWISMPERVIEWFLRFIYFLENSAITFVINTLELEKGFRLCIFSWYIMCIISVSCITYHPALLAQISDKIIDLPEKKN